MSIVNLGSLVIKEKKFLMHILPINSGIISKSLVMIY